MATLNELITQIEQNQKFIKIVEGQDYTFYKFYTIYWNENNIIRSTSICIYINNRGLANESAYFKDANPEILRDDTPNKNTILLEATKAKIADIKTADPTIEKVTITNTTEDVVECTAYKYNSSNNTVSKINVVFYYDDTNKLLWRKLA